MLNLGSVPAGSTLYIPFSTYSGTTGASITCSGLAVTDIEIYKNGSATQRASDAGYALLDTDGIDFDGITGIHGFSIDLSDNTDAGFYAVGSFYWVIVSSITVDTQTVNFIAATFRIGAAEVATGYPDVTVATGGIAAASFAAGALTADAFAADALVAATFATDSITADAIANGAIDAAAFAANAITSTVIADDAITAAKINTGAFTADAFAADALVATTFATDSITADAIAADTVTEIQTGLALEATSLLIKAKTDNLPSGVAKGVALSAFEFVMVDTTDHITPMLGLAPAGTISQDGGAFAPLTNAVAEVGSGVYKVDLTAAEMNADVITLLFTAALADTRIVTILTS